ncbi:MAG: DUF4397 domain-containing protein [Planctomycetota bacterium]
MSRLTLAIGALGAISLAPVVIAGNCDSYSHKEASNPTVRVIHASPNTPEVDIFAGAADLPSSSVQNRVLQDVPYFTASPRLEVPSGTYFFDVVAPAAGYTPAIDLNEIKLKNDKEYTVIAAGDVSDGVDAFLFIDDNEHVEGKAKVRLIHAFENLTVDVAESGLGTIANNFEYGTASSYYELPPGAYNFSLLNEAGDSTIANLPELDLEADAVYTVIVTGYVGVAPEAQVLVDVAPDTQTASVIDVHYTQTSSNGSNCGSH